MFVYIITLIKIEMQKKDCFVMQCIRYGSYFAWMKASIPWTKRGMPGIGFDPIPEMMERLAYEKKEILR